MESQELMALKAVALYGNPVECSTSDIGERLGLSPQSASRYLSILEDDGLIERTLLPRGQRLTVTDEGYMRLRREYAEYRRIFEGEEEHVVRGEVVEGLGEGRYYMSLEGYQAQFEEELGYRAYPGTLNLRLLDGQTHPSALVPGESVKRVEGFEEESRTFGSVVCYEAEVEGVKSAVVTPERSHHDSSIIEVISGLKLREKLDLDTGDVVEVELCC